MDLKFHVTGPGKLMTPLTADDVAETAPIVTSVLPVFQYYSVVVEVQNFCHALTVWDFSVNGARQVMPLESRRETIPEGVL